MAQVVDADPSNNRYQVRYRGAQQKTTNWVDGNEMIPITRTPDIRKVGIDIEGRGVRFYDNVGQQQIDALSEQGVVAVRSCNMCNQLYRDFVRHYRQMHNQPLAGFADTWQPPELQPYSAYHGKRRIQPTTSRGRAKRRKRDVDDEDDEDDWDMHYLNSTLNRGFIEDDDDDDLGGGAVGGGGGGFPDRPRIRVLRRSDLGAQF